jgi:putative DNA primase/helicase
VPTPVEGKGKGNGSGRVMLNTDGRTGVAWNHVTGQHMRFSEAGTADKAIVPRPKREMEAERREAEEQTEVARICGEIVRACRVEPHSYLASKGFPDERGLVIDDLRLVIPAHDLGQAIIRALPEGEGPWLIVPGRIAQQVATVQIIGPDGAKKNIYRGKMRGAAHRIATGRETWVCEGIATALTVRAALRLLGRSATVYSAFSAANVAKVAQRHEGSIIAADHDKPLDQLHGKGTGEYYADQSRHIWTMPPDLGDFNDMHQRNGLRAVALHLRGVRPP